MSVLVAEPVRAWKEAYVAAEPSPQPFRPMSAAVAYGTHATAVCSPLWGDPGDHAAPDEDCSCGFYALPDRIDRYVPLRALLSVDLSGKVVEHERGFRAERQQVTGVFFGPDCARCGSGARMLSGYQWFEPACAGCAARLPHAAVTLGYLAGRLGVQVGWAEWAERRVPSAEVTYQLGVSALAAANAMQQAFDRMAAVFAQASTDVRAVAVEPDDDTPTDPLQAKRRRDRQRQQRLERLSGQRRPPRELR